MKFFKDKAIFINDEKTLIQAHVAHDGYNEDIIIEVTPNEKFDRFIEQVTLEEVEVNTKEFFEAVEEADKKERRILIDILKKELEESGFNTSQESSEVVSSSFDPNNLTTEDLFKLKLQSFEIEAVKTSKNRELKAKIRKANSFMEVMAYTTATILDNQE